MIVFKVGHEFASLYEYVQYIVQYGKSVFDQLITRSTAERR